MNTPVKLFVMPERGVIPKQSELKKETFKAKPTPIVGEVSLDKTVMAIITSQLALNANEAMKYTEYYKHGLKAALKKSTELLIKAEATDYDKIFDSQADATTALYNITEQLAKTLLKVNIRDYNELCEVVSAYVTDPKSITGLAKKINRKNAP